MDNPQKRPIPFSRSVCVIEVTRDRNDPPMFFQCMISIPGRPGMFTRTWPSGGKAVDRHQINDLMAWLALTVHSAIALSAGIQETLGEDET